MGMWTGVTSMSALTGGHLNGIEGGREEERFVT